MKINVIDRTTGHETRFDTKNIDYKAIWKEMELSPYEKRGASLVIEYFDKKPDEIMEIPEHLKGFCDYRKRSDLEKAGGKKIVQMLIDNGILNLHRRWEEVLKEPKQEIFNGIKYDTMELRYDPAAVYKIDYMHLYEEMREIDPEFGEDWD